MARPQNSPRGLFSKKVFGIPNTSGAGFIFEAYSATTPLIAADSNGLVLAGAIKITGTARLLTVNSTGWKLGSRYISTNTTGNVTT